MRNYPEFGGEKKDCYQSASFHLLFSAERPPEGILIFEVRLTVGRAGLTLAVIAVIIGSEEGLFGALDGVSDSLAKAVAGERHVGGCGGFELEELSGFELRKMSERKS